MSNDENRISDQIESGLKLKTEIQAEAYEMYENMFYCIPSKGLSVKEHDEAAKKCAKLAAIVGKHNSRNDNYWNLIIKEIDSI